jgi:hypothetical protein
VGVLGPGKAATLCAPDPYKCGGRETCAHVLRAIQSRGTRLDDKESSSDDVLHQNALGLGKATASLALRVNSDHETCVNGPRVVQACGTHFRRRVRTRTELKHTFGIKMRWECTCGLSTNASAAKLVRNP